MFTDTVQSYGGSMLSVVPKKELGSANLADSGVCCPVTALCKTNVECYFCFSPYFCKSKNPLWLSFLKGKINVGLS